MHDVVNVTNNIVNATHDIVNVATALVNAERLITISCLTQGKFYKTHLPSLSRTTRLIS